MLITIKNGSVEAAINTRGAELTHLKKNGDEYIWEKDANSWKACAPVLFPMVSSVLNKQYTHKGKVYPLPQHGFARDCEFDVVEQSESCVVMRLVQNHLTSLVYPFSFDFSVSFALEGDKLNIDYIVKNTSADEEMYFNTGAHEGYKLFSSTVDDHYIEFEKKEKLLQMVLTEPVWEGETHDFGESNVLELKDEYFAIDGIFFVGINSDHVTLRSKSSDKAVRVYFDCDNIGFWKIMGAGYLCIEPWDGFCPYKGDSSELSEKRFIKTLPPKGEYKFYHGIEIL